MDTIRYATLAQTRSELRERGTSAQAANATNQVEHDEYLLRTLAEIAKRIDGIKGYTFAPNRTTVRYDAEGSHIDDYRGILHFDRPWLTIEQVRVDGVLWAAGTDYVTVPRDGTPISGLRVLPGSGKAWNQYAIDWQDAITVTGMEGYHTHYAGALVSTGAIVPAGGMTADAVSFPTVDINGRDVFRRAPRFSAAQLLQIGTELLEVLETEISGSPSVHTVYVRRGVRGTTAAGHAEGDPILTYLVDERVQRATFRWADYVYKRRGSFATLQTDLATGTVYTEFPPDIPEEAAGILDELPCWNIAEGV
jgi:hypothetical protein